MSGSLTPDTSIYSTIKGPVPQEAGGGVNPLAMAQGFQQLQRTGLENNQMMQMQTAKLAIGSAAQNAIDPNTGQIDDTKFLQGVAADPRSAFLVNDMANSLAARKLQESEVSTQQLRRGLDTAEAMTQGLGTLYNDPNLTREKVYDTVNSYLQMAPHGEALPIAMNFIKQLPPLAPGQQDTPETIAQIRQQIGRAQTGFKNSADTFKGALPEYEASRTANGDLIWNKNSLTLGTNAPLHGAFVNTGMTPAEALGSQPVVGPNGVTQQVPNTTFAGARGVLPAGTVTSKAMPPAGPLGAIAGVQQAPVGGQGPAQAPTQNANPLGWGQGPATRSPTPLPSPAATAPASPRPPPGAFDPGTIPGIKGAADPAAALASGQPYQAALSPGQEEMQKEKVQDWQKGRQALSATLQGDQNATNAIMAEEAAQKQYMNEPGAQSAGKWAQSMKAVADLASGVPGMAWIANTADHIIKNPDDPDNGKNAIAAMQAWNAFAFQTKSALFGKVFQANGSPGSTKEFEGVNDNYMNNTMASGAKQSIYDFAKQLHAYDLAKSQAAQIYENKANETGAVPDFNDFSNKWTQHALTHGFGSDASSPNDGAVVKPPGDGNSLLQSVGLHPQANEHSLDAPQALPTMRGTGLTPDGKKVTGLWQRAANGQMQLLKAD